MANYFDWNNFDWNDYFDNYDWNGFDQDDYNYSNSLYRNNNYDFDFDTDTLVAPSSTSTSFSKYFTDASDFKPTGRLSTYQQYRMLNDSIQGNDWLDTLKKQIKADQRAKAAITTAATASNNSDKRAGITTEEENPDKKSQGERKGGKIRAGAVGLRAQIYNDTIKRMRQNREKLQQKEQEGQEENAETISQSENKPAIEERSGISDYSPKDDYLFTERLFNGMGNQIDIATEFIKKQEGFSPVYRGDAGGASIGYGIWTTKPDLSKRVTRQEAEQMTRDMLINELEPQLKHIIPDYDMLNDNMKAALLSYIYNVGEGNLKSQKKLIGAIQRHDWEGAADAIRNGINTSNKVELKGLTARRSREADLFLS